MRAHDEGPPPPSRVRVAGALLSAGVAGAAVLVAELAVVRVGAPWFGQSVLVWSNAIGVVLGALALGYALGGRLAAAGATSGTLTSLFAFAAAWLALAARLAAPLADALVPVDLGGDRPLAFSFAGSLAATAWLVGPPCVALAAASPLLVARVAARWGPGRAAGAVGAAGTLGSLAGAAATPLALIPALGARGALAVAALAAAGAALGWAALPRHEVVAHPPEAAGPPRQGRGSANAGSVAFLLGLVVTTVEFAASRALAPRLGGGHPTWAVVVAVVLGALAVGNAVGGRWAARPGAVARVARAALLLAAVLLLVPALAADPLTRAFAPRIVEGPTGPSLSAGGTLPAALLLFAAPLLLLGTASPALVRGLAPSQGAARASGFVFAWGTAGSVLGCWTTPILLLPALGVRGTFLACAGGLLAAAALWPGRRSPVEPSPASPPRSPEGAHVATRRPGSLAAAAAAGAMALAAFLAPFGPLREDPGQLAEVETAYQSVRAVESEEVAPRPGPYPLYGPSAPLRQRFLRFDEDAASYQSVRVLEEEETTLTAGRYYDHLALGAWFDGMPWTAPRPRAPRVLVLGYAGGTLHRILDRVAPAEDLTPDVTGVELDPAVLDLARRHVGGVPARGRVFAGDDGRAVLEALPADAPFDLIFVDAYQRTQYVPFQLATKEFFRACAARLAPTGALGVNLHAPRGLEGALLQAVARTLSEALGPRGSVWLVPNPQYPSNVVVWGRRGSDPPRVALAAPPALAGAAHALDRLLVRFVPTAGERGGLVLTDDRAPVERLSDDALLSEAGR